MPRIIRMASIFSKIELPFQPTETSFKHVITWGNYISPFVPHSFTARADAPEAIIIAVGVTKLGAGGVHKVLQKQRQVYSISEDFVWKVKWLGKHLWFKSLSQFKMLDCWLGIRLCWLATRWSFLALRGSHICLSENGWSICSILAQFCPATSPIFRVSSTMTRRTGHKAEGGSCGVWGVTILVR